MVGIKQVLVVLLVALVTVAPLPSRAELLLERVVMLSRHGVRAPTMSNDTLAQFSSRPWPTCTVNSPRNSLASVNLRDTERSTPTASLIA